MLQIAKNEINSFNGLAGDGETGTAAAQTGGTSNNNGWQTAQNMIDSTSTLINAGANFVDSLNNNSSSSNGTNYTPNYNWGVTPAPQKQTDYLPWILGGLGVVLLFGVVMFNKK